MALLNWNRRRYSVGVAKLDDQHAVFIGGLNKLHGAMIMGQGKTITGHLLQTLIDNAREHTSAEEALMTSTNYPGLAHHRAEHQKLVAKFAELQAQHQKGEDSVCIPLLQFMRDWLSTHILEEDRKYTPWLQEHGAHSSAQPNLAAASHPAQHSEL
ncbi:MAG: bacteriohemerythrin [Terracidiphilus sp.]|nr:bacteriohemerythrin [Terracidiphilus sp.]